MLVKILKPYLSRVNMILSKIWQVIILRFCKKKKNNFLKQADTEISF